MPAESPTRSAPRRIDVIYEEVVLPYHSSDEFVREHAPFVTRGGMFVRHDQPRAPGSIFPFRLVLLSGEELFRARGVVRWVCRKSGDGHLPGMGVLFSDVTGVGLALIDRMALARGRKGITPEPPSHDEVHGKNEADDLPQDDFSTLLSWDFNKRAEVPTVAPVRLEAPRKRTPIPTWLGDGGAVAPPVQPPVAEPVPTPGKTQLEAPVVKVVKAPVPPPPPEIVEATVEIVEAPKPPEPAQKVLAKVALASVPRVGVPQQPVEVALAPPPVPSVDDQQPPVPEPKPPVRPAPPPAPAPSVAVTPQPAQEDTAAAMTRVTAAIHARDFATAETLVMKLIAREPNAARLRYELGMLYSEWSASGAVEHDSGAEAAFARAVELDPEFDLPRVQLGYIQLRRGLLDEARASLNEAVRRNPSSRAAQEGLRYHATLRWKRNAIRVVYGAVPVGIAAVVAAWAVVRAPEPERLVEVKPAEVIAVQPQRVEAPAPVVAVQAAPVAPVVAPQPESPPPAEPTQVSARAPVDSKPVAAAAEPAQSAPPRTTTPRPPRPAKSSGPSASALVKKGSDALRSGRADDALESFQGALKIDAKNAPAYRGLGAVYVMQGKERDAAAAYRQYLALAPNASDAARIRALLEEMQ